MDSEDLQEKTDTLVLPPLEDVEKFFMTINNWLVHSTDIRAHKSENFHKSACEAWKSLGDLFKYKYDDMRNRVLETLPLGTSTLQTWKNLNKLSKSNKSSRSSIEMTHNGVCISALNCIQNFFPSVNTDLEKGCVDESHFEKYDAQWSLLLSEIFRCINFGEVPVACAMLDLLSALGNDMYSRMTEREQRQLIVFLIGHGNSSDYQLAASPRAKIGRCLGKLIEFPTLHNDLGFFLDLFSIIVENIAHGENVLKISYAWTFGNFTDALVSAHFETSLESLSPRFLPDLLETALKSTQVPPRGRYSACRACGNIFKWMKLEMVNDPAIKGLIKEITDALVAMVGNGLDYKLRWNAAHAVGHAIENEIFFTVMKTDVTDPIIKTLVKWMAQSQNYKERTQCVISLIKVKVRQIYGSFYPLLWQRACVAISRIPVEDCDNIEKFKTEVILMVFHLVSVLEFQDLEIIQSTILENEELLKSAVSECVRKIPLERLDEAVLAKESISILRENARGTPQEATVLALINIMSDAWKEDSVGLIDT